MWARRLFGVVLSAAIVLHAGLAIAAPVGLASWYGAWHEGRRMANSCPFHANSLTAASLVFPIGAWVRVRNRRNQRSVTVEITDRGPYIPGRVIDLSRAAADVLDMEAAGLAPVDIERLPDRTTGRRC
jgi:rare lipoprotein A